MVGPNGLCSISDQACPTMTGLMKSGTMRMEMTSPLPLKVFAIVKAIVSPSRNSTATLVKVSETVTQSE